MLIELKEFWFIETSEVTEIRLDVAGWYKKYPVIRIDTKSKKPIFLSDFNTIEELKTEFERLVSLFNEWLVYLNKHKSTSEKVIVKTVNSNTKT